MIVQYSEVHDRSLRFIARNISEIPIKQQSKFVSKERAEYIFNSLIKLSEILENTNFYLSGGLSIPLMLHPLNQYWGEASAITRGKEIRSAIVKGVYRNHSSIKISIFEHDLESLVKKAHDSGYSLCERTSLITIPWTKYKRDSYREITPEQAIKNKNIRLLKTRGDSNLEKLSQKEMLSHIDLFICHYEPLPITPEEHYQQLLKPNAPISPERLVVSNDPCLDLSNRFKIIEKLFAGPKIKLKGRLIKTVSPIYLFQAKQRIMNINKKGLERDKLDCEILAHLIDWWDFREYFREIKTEYY